MAEPFIELAKLAASDGAGSDFFGDSVAIDGDTVVVATPFDDGRGSAYVFVRPAAGWSGTLTETAKLTVSDGEAGDLFGFSAGVIGDTVVVGAPGDDIGSNAFQGSAYIFVKPAGGWSETIAQTAKLTASDGAASDYFGVSVAISGDTAVIAADGDDSLTGSAYVFVKPPGGWATGTETAKLTASDRAELDLFGRSAAISGDTVTIGAYGDDNFTGAAYVFVQSAGGWAYATETAKLTASDGTAGDVFGWSAWIDGDTVVVGAPTDTVGINYAQGSAYVFVRPPAGWSGTLTETAYLTASDGAANDWLGYSAGISGDTVVVGANLDDSRGSAYVFVGPPSGWVDANETAKLTASDGVAGDQFGASMGISGGMVVVGAPNNNDQGSAYVFGSFDLFLPLILKNP